MTQTVEEARKALWDHINSLEPGPRERAIAYQRGLEEEAARTPGGMMEVISRRLKYNSLMLQGALAKLQEEVASLAANVVIAKVSAKWER